MIGWNVTELELGRRVELHLVIDNDLSRAARLVALEVRFADADSKDWSHE